MDREPSAVPKPAIATNLHESLNVQIHFAAKIALDCEIPINDLTKTIDLIFR
jgi:hypothetical protein